MSRLEGTQMTTPSYLSFGGGLVSFDNPARMLSSLPPLSPQVPSPPTSHQSATTKPTSMPPAPFEDSEPHDVRIMNGVRTPESQEKPTSPPSPTVRHPAPEPTNMAAHIPTKANAELQNITPSREASPAISEASSDRTHISSNMRPVLQIPPFVPVQQGGSIGYRHPQETAIKSFGAQDFEQSSSEDEGPISRQNRPDRGPDHGSLPPHLQQQLDEYYGVQGTSRPPPCAMNKIKQSQLEGRRAGRHPLKYTNKSGEKLIASCKPIGFDNKYVLTVEGKTQPPVIIKYFSLPGAGAAQKQTPYLVWKGITGWEKEPSVWKVRDDDATPEVKSTKHLIAEPRKKSRDSGTPKVVLSGKALNNCKDCKDRHRRCDKSLPSCSTCVELNIPCHYAKGSIPESGEVTFISTANSNGSTDVTESEVSEEDYAQQGIEISTELPPNLRNMLEVYYKKTGSRTAPPCSLSAANTHAIYAFARSGVPAQYVNPEGKRLSLQRHYLAEHKTYANVIYGLEREPVFVKAQSAGRNPHFGPEQASYVVWDANTGLEKIPRVLKIAETDRYRESPQVTPSLVKDSTRKPTAKRLRDDDNGGYSNKRAKSNDVIDRDAEKAASKPFRSLLTSDRSMERPRPNRRVTTQNVFTPPQEKGLMVRSKLDRTKSLTPSASLSAIAPSASSILSQDQKLRTTLTFFGGTRERTRLFTVCDSVKKLYMQAAAAGLFANFFDTSIPFLTLQVAGKQIAIIRDDEDDFEDLEQLILQEGPWNDGVGAVCLVEASIAA